MTDAIFFTWKVPAFKRGPQNRNGLLNVPDKSERKRFALLANKLFEGWILSQVLRVSGPQTMEWPDLSETKRTRRKKAGEKGQK